MKTITLEIFINRAKLKHGDKYNYSIIKYINTKIKISIICKIHGVFAQTPSSHMSGSGCPDCSKYKPKDEDFFIKKSSSLHKGKYDYSLVKYKTIHDKVTIICPEHGEFEQLAKNHMKKSGCPICVGKNKTTDSFIKECLAIHNDRYDYSLVKYMNGKTKISVICKEHGEFILTPNDHLNGNGCPICAGKNKTTDFFINECFIKHNDKYDYSLVVYKGSKIKIDIICKKHGVFKQTPSEHLANHGCPICKSSKGELRICKLLEDLNINYIKQYMFDDCKFKNKLPFDFYLPEHNTCIEYNGEQHYKSIKYFGGDTEFENRKIRDGIKKDFCENNNIKLLIIKYNEDIQEKLKEL